MLCERSYFLNLLFRNCIFYRLMSEASSISLCWWICCVLSWGFAPFCEIFLDISVKPRCIIYKAAKPSQIVYHKCNACSLMYVVSFITDHLYVCIINIISALAAPEWSCKGCHQHTYYVWYKTRCHRLIRLSRVPQRNYICKRW